KAGHKVLHLQDPQALAEFADDKNQNLVLSTFGGANSRSRLALVPALCETFGIPYVGLDAHGQSICHDKWVTKQIAKDCGLLVPRGHVIRKKSDLQFLQGADFPLMVKPLTEGSSIGISQDSIVYDAPSLELQVGKLLKQFSSSVLAEAFVRGREVAYCAISGASPEEIGVRSFNEIAVRGDAGYFEDRVWSANEKKRKLTDRYVRSIDSELGEKDRAALERLLLALGDYGYIRIDGRLHKGRFYFIEATPDAYLGPQGQVAQGFMNAGWSYPEVLEAILQTARSRLHGQPAID
ncbi:MAG: D-alanine--D-alanine ligase, partial [Rhodobacteraceae bacterium]|nr:D-alanine--D-alanine ligase [Paracoccaceae bacterium]